MINSRRDYILRIIDEISRMIARIVFKRQAGADQEALEIVVQGFQRLFNLQPEQLFQFTPDHHYVMLTLDEPPDIARDKVLLYAALNAEAGQIYAKMGNQAMARTTLTNALQFALKAREIKCDAPLPDFAPNIEALADTLGRDSLDEATRAMLGPIA